MEAWITHIDGYAILIEVFLGFRAICPKQPAYAARTTPLCHHTVEFSSTFASAFMRRLHAARY